MSQLRAIIIDDDRNRREGIVSLLPDYFASVAIGYGDGALDYLKPDAEGVVPDIVLLYGDDAKSLGLYVYDWMINKSGNPDIAMIPVVVMTEDEFSDRCMEFLEIGDVVFYEGEAEESRLFSVITEAIEKAEFMPEPVITGYEDVKNIERIAGTSVKAPDDDGSPRVVVLDMESRMENLEAALERGRKRASDIRTLIDAATKVKGAKNTDEDGEFSRRRSRNGYSEYKKRISNKNAGSQAAPTSSASSASSAASDSVAKLKEKAMGNPYGAFNAQGSIKLEEPERQIRSTATYEKKTVVIVDDDVKTRKLCSLFLTQNHNVIAFESGMKTVDYFVRNRADLLIINPNLPGMSGISVVNSVHMQPGCANVPVMYLVGDDFTQSRTSLVTPGVVGILNKPIKREMISQAVEGLFGTNR